MKVYLLRIYLADNEWGNELMQEVAKEAFSTHEGQLSPFVVDVREHAGWFLQYTLIDKKMVVVGTANDMANFGVDAQLFRERIWGAEIVELPEIRRQKAEELVT